MVTKSHLNLSADMQARSYSMNLKFSVFLSTVCALIRAKYIMTMRNIGRMTLPNINPQSPISTEIMIVIVQWVKRWVHMFSIRSRHGCYYRSYVLACILREKGIPVSLNIGLRNLRSREKNRGHCWLTLNGKPVFDPDDQVPGLYCHRLKQGNSDINYWIGSNDAGGIMRHKLSRGNRIVF